MEELQRLLRQSDGESLDLEEKGGKLLSEEDLKVLTDRSEAAYVKAEEDGAEGKESSMFKSVEKVKENSLLDGFKA
jgi:ATP-dependent DNA helicase